MCLLDALIKCCSKEVADKVVVLRWLFVLSQQLHLGRRGSMTISLYFVISIITILLKRLSHMYYHYLSECDTANAPPALYLVIWHRRHGQGELVNTYNNNVSCTNVVKEFASKNHPGCECLARKSSDNLGGLRAGHSLNSMSRSTYLYYYLAIKLILQWFFLKHVNLQM